MKNIVTVGGGTGSYTVLSGLKNLPNVSLVALVSMADNGGSTGVLRDELGVLPPGDVRQCLVALSEHSNIVRELINYRFSEGKLTGHSFGNIFLAALEKVTGDFAKGVEIASEILKVKGDVVPVTREKAELSVLLNNGVLLDGQVEITNTNLQELGFEKIFYKNNTRLNGLAKTAIWRADYVVIGPGDYYCSVVPNLIVDGFKEAVHASSAKLILVVNFTNKQGHTKDWTVKKYVNSFERLLGKKFDFILVNTEPPSKEQIERYKLEEGDGVMVKDDFIDPRVVRAPLLSHKFFDNDENDKLKKIRGFIRHDPDKLAKCVVKIIEN